MKTKNTLAIKPSMACYMFNNSMTEDLFIDCGSSLTARSGSCLDLIRATESGKRSTSEQLYLLTVEQCSNITPSDVLLCLLVHEGFPQSIP